MNEQLFRLPFEEKISKCLQYDTDVIIDVCIKHTTRLRFYHNAVCKYLARQEKLLTRLGEVVIALDVNQLRDISIDPVAQILKVLFQHELRSVCFTNCKVEKKESVETLLKTINVDHTVRYSNECNNVVFFAEKEQCCEKERDDVSNNELFFIGQNNLKENNDQCCASSSSYLLNTGSDSSKSAADNLEEAFFFSDEGHDTDDELFEDIFSFRHFEQESPVCRGQLTSLHKQKFFPSSKLRPFCLTELKISSWSLLNDTVETFAQELRRCVYLRTLSLFDVGDSLAMYKIIESMKELVLYGSLQDLTFDNYNLTAEHFDLFCDMISSTCEECKVISQKGLNSLNVSAHGPLSLEKFGEVIKTCSFCEIHDINDHLLMTSNLVFNMNSSTDTSKCSNITRGIESLEFSFLVKHDTFTKFSRSLLRNRTLKCISLPDCELYNEDVCFICDCISGNHFTH